MFINLRAYLKANFSKKEKKRLASIIQAYIEANPGCPSRDITSHVAKDNKYVAIATVYTVLQNIEETGAIYHVTKPNQHHLYWYMFNVKEQK